MISFVVVIFIGLRACALSRVKENNKGQPGATLGARVMEESSMYLIYISESYS